MVYIQIVTDVYWNGIYRKVEKPNWLSFVYNLTAFMKRC